MPLRLRVFLLALVGACASRDRLVPADAGQETAGQDAPDVESTTETDASLPLDASADGQLGDTGDEAADAPADVTPTCGPASPIAPLGTNCLVFPFATNCGGACPLHGYACGDAGVVGLAGCVSVTGGECCPDLACVRRAVQDDDCIPTPADPFNPPPPPAEKYFFTCGGVSTSPAPGGRSCVRPAHGSDGYCCTTP